MSDGDEPVAGPSKLPPLPPVNPTQVSRDVFVLQPDKDGLGKPEDPGLILLFGWMNAKSKSLLRYMSKYTSIYPGATQVLVMSRGESNWSSEAKNLRSVKPVIEILKKLDFYGPNPPDVLVHVFSNGGGQQLLLLSHLIRQNAPKDADGQPMKPAGCLIFDSLPGDATLRSAYAAYLTPITSYPLKILTAIPITVIWWIVMATTTLIGRQDPMEVLRAGLNVPNILPWTSAKTPRVYIYGKDDQIIPSYAVEDHIAAARAEKFEVKEEAFRGSSHVAHARKDPDRYWGIVKDAWRDALKLKASL
ncbi:hypothetical protein EIP91_012219 [Steccherinum ochraceum]|uniref:Transmembrane protein 53 n=1 Tax=Steccherinum ochraceum TaxID=92696 RepID=A0A4R0RQD2_9APHY|nr:hypothetical protein EIP91_012219 [Steccherinum ochraceum]